MATFRPLNSKNTMVSNFSQVNDMMRQINKEQTTKTFKQANGNAVISGRLPYGKYGQVYYDEDGVARILIGQAPDDGRMGVWVSQAGEDVITLLGG